MASRGPTMAGRTPEGVAASASYTNPIYYYAHLTGTPRGCAVSGGAFYRPAQVTFPAFYVDRYFFTDYCGNWIYSIDPASPGTATLFASGLNAPVGLAGRQRRRCALLSPARYRRAAPNPLHGHDPATPGGHAAAVRVAETKSQVVSVRLESRPAANVTVKTDRTLSDYLITSTPSSFVFTPANWDQPQSLTITAQADGDAVDEGARISRGRRVSIVAESGSTRSTTTRARRRSRAIIPGPAGRHRLRRHSGILRRRARRRQPRARAVHHQQRGPVHRYEPIGPLSSQPRPQLVEHDGPAKRRLHAAAHRDGRSGQERNPRGQGQDRQLTDHRVQLLPHGAPLLILTRSSCKPGRPWSHACCWRTTARACRPPPPRAGDRGSGSSSSWRHKPTRRRPGIGRLVRGPSWSFRCRAAACRASCPPPWPTCILVVEDEVFIACEIGIRCVEPRPVTG